MRSACFKDKVGEQLAALESRLPPVELSQAAVAAVDRRSGAERGRDLQADHRHPDGSPAGTAAIRPSA